MVGAVVSRQDYAFGDDEEAGNRLAALAVLYEDSTREFIAAHAPAEPALAVDLGCGPGHTTALLSDTLRPGRTVGVDDSEAFLEQARAGASDGVEFLRHDVREVPLPLPPADVVFARFLLAHLPEPVAVAERWTGLLAPGGVLLLEDTERIESSNATCARYLELVRATLAAEGRDVFPGGTLAGLAGGDGWTVRHSGTVTLRRPARHYAALFAPNLRQWGPRALESGVAQELDIRRLATGLDGLLTGDGGGTVSAELRQVVLARA